MMSKEYKECENAINKLLVQEKKLIKQLKKVQRTKMEILLILANSNNEI